MQEKKDEQQIKAMRHSLAHILMQALTRLYPDAVPGVGPAVSDGFYHDFDSSVVVSEKKLPKIEAEMKKIIKEDLVIGKKMMSFEEADKFFDDKKYIYTKELAHELKAKGEKEISFYMQGEFGNMCKGPHLSSTAQVGKFKLIRIAGSYWRGDEKNKMLQRIYAYAFPTQQELDEYIKMQEEAKKRDHRKLGKELDLFTFSDLVGKGLPLWTEKGAIIRRELERFIVDEEIKRGYIHVYSPELAKVDLYRKSGHYPYYKDDMYPPMKIDDEELILRPMTCPHHFMLYADKIRSYRELPMRIAELSKLFRYEKSGELSGLIRVRSFCLADAHIICRKEQVKDEIIKVIELIEYVASVMGLGKGVDYSYRLSLGDRKNEDKYFKNDKMWDYSEQVLREVLDEIKAPYEEAEGEAAFYGPKIDIQMKNVNGKEDTAFTVQYDFCMPERFDLKFINEKGEAEQPVVVHRSSIGAIERTIAFMIERYAGDFPLWLAPVQIQILPVGLDFFDYAEELVKSFKEYNFRVHVDINSDTVGKKIRNAEKEKVPYMLVVGEREKTSGKLSVRKRGSKDTQVMEIDSFIEKIKQEIKDKTL